MYVVYIYIWKVHNKLQFKPKTLRQYFLSTLSINFKEMDVTWVGLILFTNDAHEFQIVIVRSFDDYLIKIHNFIASVQLCDVVNIWGMNNLILDFIH